MISPLLSAQALSRQLRVLRESRTTSVAAVAVLAALGACRGDTAGPSGSAGISSLAAAAAVSAGGYALTDLTPDVAHYAFALAVNDAADVTGVMVADGMEHAFRWRAGVLTDLTQPGELAHGLAINAAGVVVGFFIPADGKANAFRWEDGVRTTLPSFCPPGSGGDDRAQGINASGQIVGHSISCASGQSVPVIWENGGMVALPLPSGAAGGEATAINTTGTIVGWYVAPGADRFAIVWQNGVIIDLGLLGGAQAEAIAINDNGQVVGRRNINGEDRAFLWQNGTTIDLGSGRATAINNAGQIVGEVGQVAVRWPNAAASPIPIPDLSATSTASRAGGINAGGAIVGGSTPGIGGDLHAYLASPENKPPVADAGGPYTGNEGTAVTLTAAASSDVNGDALSYHWTFGDGTAGVTVTTATVTHVYADDGTFTAAVVATDPGSLTDDATASLTISNAAPTVNAGADAVARPGQTVLYSAGFTDPGTSDGPWAYAVAWGDGTAATTGTVTTQAVPIELTHVYAAEGTYTATFDVTDKDGGTGSDTFQVAVRSTVAPNVAITFVSSPIGSGFTATLRGTIVDPDQDGGTWSLLVAWGDGTENLTLVGGQLPTFTLTHSYASPGTVTVTARVTDATSAVGAASAPIVVALGIPIDVNPPALPCPPKTTCIKRVTKSTMQVALFSVSGFQPLQLQAAQVTLGDNLGSEAKATSCANAGDQNGDGVADTRCVFKIVDVTKAAAGAQILVLNGRLADGRRIQGQERVAGI
ncbi:MAG TPA: PKD domain-containing protein [Gemmatimonadales bacterium]|nr:PKD domain-containing protein [Gemmatimonadales bacterium]